jgi:dephospho-CoA kinase
MRAVSHQLGLTGGVATGKTTVARLFAALSAKVIDADRLGHELIQAPLPAYQEILRRFGPEILDSSREIDRHHLGAIVFAHPEKLRELNAIVHPRILERVEELGSRYRSQDPKAVILVDAALLFESGIADRFTKVLVAWCRPEQQLERLMARRGISREEAAQRIGAQMPVEEKCRRADYVIDSSGSLDQTRAQVAALYPELKRLLEESSPLV